MIGTLNNKYKPTTTFAQASGVSRGLAEEYLVGNQAPYVTAGAV